MPPVPGFESESTVEDFALKRKVGFVEILKFGKKKKLFRSWKFNHIGRILKILGIFFQKEMATKDKWFSSRRNGCWRAGLVLLRIG